MLRLALCTAVLVLSLAAAFGAAPFEPVRVQAGADGCPNDDPLENNDSLATATPYILIGEDSDLRVCSNDDDNFIFDVPALTVVQADACFTNASGNIDLYLYGPDKSAGPVAFTDGTSDHEHIAYLDQVSQAYGLQITLTGGSTNTYDLLITTGPPGATLGDVDGNGAINPVDAALVLQFTVDYIYTMPNGNGADVNGTCSLNAIDAALILQYSAGIISSL